MSGFAEKLKLKELAEEDIYFARRDRELIKALHEKELAKAVGADGKKARKRARSFEKKYRQKTRKHKHHPGRLAQAYRKLIRKILVAFHLLKK